MNWLTEMTSGLSRPWNHLTVLSPANPVGLGMDITCGLRSSHQRWAIDDKIWRWKSWIQRYWEQYRELNDEEAAWGESRLVEKQGNQDGIQSVSQLLPGPLKLPQPLHVVLCPHSTSFYTQDVSVPSNEGKLFYQGHLGWTERKEVCYLQPLIGTVAWSWIETVKSWSQMRAFGGSVFSYRICPLALRAVREPL